MAADLHITLDGTPVPVYLGENTTLALNAAERAAASEAVALAAAGPNYANTGAGLAATSEGDTFAVEDGGIVTIYRHDSGPTATELRVLATTAALASPDPGKGVSLAKLEDGRNAQQAFDRLIALGGVDATLFGSLQEAVTHAEDNDLGFVMLGPGRTEITSKVIQASHGIAIIGATQTSPKQTGSGDYKPSQLVWKGGAEPMFSTTVTYGMFANLTVLNEGNGSEVATDFLECNSGSQGYTLRDVTFLVVGSASAFTRSIIRSNGNRLGYTVVERVDFKSAAPKFIDIDGQGTSNGLTWIHHKGCTFDASAADATIVYVKDETIESVTFDQYCTFISNSPGADLTIVDTTDTPATVTIANLIVDTCELDQGPAGDADWRYFKLVNVPNFIFNRTHVNGGGGTRSALGCLQNSNLTQCVGNYFSRMGIAFEEALPFNSGGTTAIAVADTITGATSGTTATVQRVVLTSGSWAGGDAAGYLAVKSATGPFISGENLDVGGSTNLATTTAALTSTANVGANFSDASNSENVFTNRSMGVERLTYAATINMSLKHGNTRHHVFEVDVTDDAANFTLTFRNQSGYARPVPGTLFTYIVRNKSGGNLTANRIRFSAVFKTAGTVTNPANGFSRCLTFMWDGTSAVELYRSTADVANS